MYIRFLFYCFFICFVQFWKNRNLANIFNETVNKVVIVPFEPEP